MRPHPFLLLLLCLAAGPLAARPSVTVSATPDADALATHARTGGTLVIDLRTPPEGLAEEAVTAAGLGLEYVNLPVGRAAASPAVVERVTRLIEGADGAVLLHCGSGNRAGEVYARYLIGTGMTREEALERARGVGLQPGREPFVPEP